MYPIGFIYEDEKPSKSNHTKSQANYAYSISKKKKDQ